MFFRFWALLILEFLDVLLEIFKILVVLGFRAVFVFLDLLEEATGFGLILDFFFRIFSKMFCPSFLDAFAVGPRFLVLAEDFF